MVQINWTEQAINDSKSIYNYISENSLLYAKITIRKFKIRVKILHKQIKIGRVVPEIEREDIRELIEGNYRIVYRVVSKNQVDIISVFHSSRDMTKFIIDKE